MAITPQLIKDQEFEVKFRGWDPLEVRDYLEQVADEFFELQERCAEQLEELETLRNSKENSEDYTGSLEADMEVTRKLSAELKESCTQKDATIQELNKEIEELQLRIADMEQEDTEHAEEVSTMEAMLEEIEETLKKSEVEKTALKSKIEILKEQNDELKKDEVDFKSTLASAQRFAEELKEKSKTEAEEMIAGAHAEIEKIRSDAREELERLPREIDILQKKKGEVRADLKATLEGYLETIDVFCPEGGTPQDLQVTPEVIAGDNDSNDDVSELYQKIELAEDGSLSPDDVARLNDDKILDSLLQGGELSVINEQEEVKEDFSRANKEDKR